MIRQIQHASALIALSLLCATACPAADAGSREGASMSASNDTPHSREWNPLSLNTAASPDEVSTYKQAFDVNMATAGYLYALPAYIDYVQRYVFLSTFRNHMGDKGSPFGQFLLLRTPASPDALDVMPNYDTLYGVSFLELKDLPMVLTVPDIPNRYYSFALLDAYFYNFAYVGSRTTGQKAGNYLLVGPDWRGEAPAGFTQVIKCPTNTIHIYERIYFRNKQDLPAVNAVQDKIKLTPLPIFLDPHAKVEMPDPSVYMSFDPAQVKSPMQVLRIANQHMGANPPPPEDQTMLEYFAPTGIGPGLKLPQDAYSQSVLDGGAAAAEHAMTALAMTGFVTKNGWQIPPPNVGKRGGPGGMAMNAMIQLRSVGINAPEEAVYYIAYDDGISQALNSRNNYVLKFTADNLPPTLKEKFGFWSVTMYDRANLKLVANASDKYSVRSADDLVYGSDGSLTIYIQTDPPADKKLQANWLPAPKQGEFVLMLRVYLGAQSVVAGTYVPPPVKPVQ